MNRRVRQASVSAIGAVVVLGLLVAVNVVASRSSRAWDLTSAGNNTLAPQSVLAARKLTSDLQVIGMFRPASPLGEVDAEALIALYAEQSSHVKYRREDIGTDVADVKRYAVTQDNTIVLDYGGKTQLLVSGSQAEQDFTAAILRLESNHVPVVCWASGVGGRSLADPNTSTGYSAMADLLNKNAFTTRDLLVTQVTAIPAECDVVALVGATLALREPAVKALDDYLAGGGSLFVASDPWADAAVTASIDLVLKPYGPGFSGGLVIEADPSRYVAGNPTICEVSAYGRSPIAADVSGVESFFPQATAITGAPAAAVTAVPIATTSTSAYGVQQPRPAQSLGRQPGDTAGPFTIMETLEGATGGKPARIVMVGTAAFAENGSLPPYSLDANTQLAVGSFEWLAGQDSLVTFAPKPDRALPLTLTQDDQSTLIFITAVLMPGIVVVAGIAVWWRRRIFV